MALEKRKIFGILTILSSLLLIPACAGTGNRNASVAEYSAGGIRVAVNRYLWTASLQTLDFLPVRIADPVAGLIITEWYVNPELPGERLKADVYILDSALRADALRVSVFRQERDPYGGWTDVAVSPSTGREIENAILSRARELRLGSYE